MENDVDLNLIKERETAIHQLEVKCVQQKASIWYLGSFKVHLHKLIKISSAAAKDFPISCNCTCVL